VETNEFTCTMCRETFDKAWTDDEAWAEARQLWTAEEIARGTDVVCDDCFNAMTKTLPLDYWRKLVASAR
jgi:hypothetical protein